VSVWAAFLWGGFSSSSLYIGEVLAGPMRRMERLTGQVMGFGAGTLLSAVAYELIPQSNLAHGNGIGVSCLLGALVYYVADRVVDESGGADRQAIDSAEVSGSGAAMFLGALLDGIPEAFILGITFQLEESSFPGFRAEVDAVDAGSPPLLGLRLFRIGKLSGAGSGAEDAGAAVVPANAKPQRHLAEHLFDGARPPRLTDLLRLEHDPVPHTYRHRRSTPKHSRHHGRPRL
jgi:hypothetical protein